MSRARILVLLLWGALGLSYLLGGSQGPRVPPAPIKVPLARFPFEVPGPPWKGEDRPLPSQTVSVAHVSDHLSRRYGDGRRSFWLYVGYVEGWNPAGIHHPLVCFPSVGLDLAQSEVVTIDEPAGGKKASFLESQWWKEGQEERIYTLNTFYCNGKFIPDEWKLRFERLAGVSYFAVITISGKMEPTLEETRNTYFDLARTILPELLKHFPE